MRVRVAYIIDSIDSPTAGTERQLLTLIQGLDKTRFEPLLCCLRPTPWLENEWRGCRTHVTGITSLKRPVAWLGIARLASWLKANNVGVVQTHFRASSIAGTLAARFAGVPVIVGTRRGRPLYEGRLEAFLLRLVNRIPNCFVANSHFSQSLAESAEGISPARFRVIPNALDADSFPPITPETQRRARLALGLNVSDDTPVVGIVANLNPWKRHDLLLQAASHLNENGLRIRLALIGGGDQQRLRELASRLGIADQVLFAGSRQDVPELLPALDVGVICSDFESSSNALIEYLAAGLPVVCTRVGGLPESMQEGASGRIVPPGDSKALADALESILRTGLDTGEFHQFREELIERHSPEKMVAGHLAAYGFAEGGS